MAAAADLSWLPRAGAPTPEDPVPEKPPSREDVDRALYSYVAEERAARPRRAELEDERHRQVVDKLVEIEADIRAHRREVEQRFRGVEARVSDLEHGKGRSYSPPQGMQISKNLLRDSDTGSHSIVDLEKALEDRSNAATMRAIKGGAGKIVVSLLGALVTAACIFGAGLAWRDCVGAAARTQQAPAGH